MPEQVEGPSLPSQLPPHDQGSRRLVAAFLRPSRKQVVVAILLGLLGFTAVTQVRVTETDNDYSGLRQQELIDVLDALAGTRPRAQAEIERLEEARADLRDTDSQRRAALAESQADLRDLNILAGLVPVTGPGIRARGEHAAPPAPPPPGGRAGRGGRGAGRARRAGAGARPSRPGGAAAPAARVPEPLVPRHRVPGRAR
jgi:hypothetical protein